MQADERDYAEALAILVHRFEQDRRRSSLPKLTPIDRLKFLMQEHAMTVNDLARVLGSQPNASLILHGKLSLYPAKLRDKILLNRARPRRKGKPL
ncbi:MAG TPA: hypothetical protein VHX86_09475 [Tepidisphaeraceae bacterium]|jgi:antitoxin component HigA of HigAB toxin-antitoxin module|nr:hypothetical protein [Tepidisphaeraceae bacterium]